MASLAKFSQQSPYRTERTTETNTASIIAIATGEFHNLALLTFLADYKAVRKLVKSIQLMFDRLAGLSFFAHTSV